MVTPAEALTRCEAEIEPDRSYALAELAPLLGLSKPRLARICGKGLPAERVRAEGSRGAAPWRVIGADALTFARGRAAGVEDGTGVAAVADSKNVKLGRAALTVVARQSCPACPFQGQGCYAEHDNNRIWWDRLTAGAPTATPLELARAEAIAIDRLPADRDLRLHVAGDSKTVEGTRMIAAACGRYLDRAELLGHAVAVWAYSHAWREVPREAWGRVSVLASCETADDVRLANARGYAAALVVPEFLDDAAYTLGGVKMLPCPQQTREKVCTECRLCFGDQRLHRAGLAIGFAVHGWGSNKARAALRRVALPMAA